MMYRMKNIITHDEVLHLPKCMYHIKNPNDSLLGNENNINISDQVIRLLKGPNKKMAELEQRQDQLLKKLDILYDRIKTISSICKINDVQQNFVNNSGQIINLPEEVVLNLSPDNLPWYLNVFLKNSSINANITWHIHSSVPNEKVSKIKAFVKNLKNNSDALKINLRLIFKSVSADPELKLSTLAIPIVGNVNILRYLALVYSSILPYDYYDHNLEGFLDLCHKLEKTPEKNKEAIILQLFSQAKNWIYDNKFSVVDLAAYNAIKQIRSKPKSVPKEWFDKCEKLCI